VRVEGERIAGIGSDAPPRVDGVIEIEAAGRVLMPGLIDAHAHLSIIGNITEQTADRCRFASSRSLAKSRKRWLTALPPCATPAA
jgi:imidazolonepropionase-like amidohydrolase